jgi:hypothetical protein
MIYRVPYEPGAVRTGEQRHDTDTSEEETIIVPSNITREWRRRLADSQRQAAAEERHRRAHPHCSRRRGIM